jgi:hypothetical protein
VALRSTGERSTAELTLQVDGRGNRAAGWHPALDCATPVTLSDLKMLSPEPKSLPGLRSLPLLALQHARYRAPERRVRIELTFAGTTTRSHYQSSATFSFSPGGWI